MNSVNRLPLQKRKKKRILCAYPQSFQVDCLVYGKCNAQVAYIKKTMSMHYEWEVLLSRYTRI